MGGPVTILRGESLARTRKSADVLIASPADSPSTDELSKLLPAIEVSVVMPCLNEAETLATCIGKAMDCLRRLRVSGEVIVADNGSTDGSIEIALSMGARVVNVPILGYGAALRAGISAARGEYVIMADADDSYDFSNLDPFLERLRAGDELVIGNRFRGGIAPGAMPPLHRYVGNPALSLIGRVFFHAEAGDFHCGLRGVRRTSILALELRTTGMEFASEMVVKAVLHGLRVSEVPTTLHPDGRSGQPHLRTWSDGWRHLRFLLLYSPRWLYLYPGVALMLVGSVVMAWLLPGPRHLGGVGFDLQTMLFAGGAIVLGYQAVLFAGLGKVFAITEGLLPDDARLNKLLKYVRLETGLLVGVLLLLIGSIGSVDAFLQWDARSYGPLNPSHAMRVTVPSLVAVMLGFETVLGSFFLSLLGVRRADAVEPPEP
jgi:glycosyltransferase involved in cell wall biosynthesis